MRFTQPTTLSFWHVGGEVISTDGPMTVPAARSRFGELSRLALDAEQRGDADARRFLAEQATQIFKALWKLDEHQCARTCTPRHHSPLADFWVGLGVTP